MSKKYFARIIANDNAGLKVISACCSGAEIKIADIKYLQKNKVFLLSLKRSKIETAEPDKKVISYCKFEFVDHVKSKNINQNNPEQKLKLISMNYLKKNDNYEISLIFSNNAYITLLTEIIEVSLDDDQNKIDE